MGAAGDDSDLSTVRAHCSAMPGDAARVHLQPDHASRGTIRLDLLERLAADEVAFLELDGPAEACLVGVYRLVHVVAPEAKRGLETGRIARAEAGGQHTRGAAIREYRVPDFTDPIRADEQLEPILAG